jgi:hypothetical protein
VCLYQLPLRASVVRVLGSSALGCSRVQTSEQEGLQNARAAPQFLQTGRFPATDRVASGKMIASPVSLGRTVQLAGTSQLPSLPMIMLRLSSDAVLQQKASESSNCDPLLSSFNVPLEKRGVARPFQVKH